MGNDRYELEDATIEFETNSPTPIVDTVGYIDGRVKLRNPKGGPGYDTQTVYQKFKALTIDRFKEWLRQPAVVDLGLHVNDEQIADNIVTIEDNRYRMASVSYRSVFHDGEVKPEWPAGKTVVLTVDGIMQDKATVPELPELHD